MHCSRIPPAFRSRSITTTFPAPSFFAAAAAVSFLIKLIRLKRIVRIRVPEILMALLILSAFLGSRGEAGKGDGSEVFLTYLLFGGLWFLIANTIKTGTLYRKLIACLMYGGMITLAMTGAGALLLAFRLGEWHALIPATTRLVSRNGVLRRIMYRVLKLPVLILPSWLFRDIR